MNALVPVTTPDGVVTTTSAGPMERPAGVVTEIEVDELTTKLLAATPPIVTEVVPVKLTPVMVVVVPPAKVPTFGDIDVKAAAAMVVKF